MPGASSTREHVAPADAAAAGEAAAKAAAKAARAGASGAPCGGRKAPSYMVQERNGWVYLFPDATRPGADAELLLTPVTIPEMVNPAFRSVGGSVEIRGGVDACVENMLDMLHISYVHSFGNMNDPVPFDVKYETTYDDAAGALQSSRVTFHYKSGPRSFSKTVGRTEEVVVTNEFHLPYTAVIRVYFGSQCVKTIMATAVPLSDDRTAVHWKLYRNFAMTHPDDAGPLNWAADWLFERMMKITFQEDKDIIENLYPEYQKGFMSAKFDRQMLAYRKAIARFQGIVAARADALSAADAAASHELTESSLQIELLDKIARTQRGQKATPADRNAILGIIRRLESDYHSPSAPGAGNLLCDADSTPATEAAAVEPASFAATAALAGVAANGESLAAARAAAVAPAPLRAGASPAAAALEAAVATGIDIDTMAFAASLTPAIAAAAPTRSATFAPAAEAATAAAASSSETTSVTSSQTAAPFASAVEGAWHLEYISHTDASEDAEQWTYAGPDTAADRARVDALKNPGSEAFLLDWNERGRPLWADTEQSMQIIDTKKGVLTNRATYKGWMGFTTTVELDAIIKPLEERANRFMVQFRQAVVDIGGQRFKFPHLGRFSPTGWLETTYVNENIRIARGNKGSIFVLTRRPLSGGSDGINAADAGTCSSANDGLSRAQ
ncbi:unnamed protein product [Phaeothamnion confervicola]